MLESTTPTMPRLLALADSPKAGATNPTGTITIVDDEDESLFVPKDRDAEGDIILRLHCAWACMIALSSLDFFPCVRVHSPS